VLVGRNERYVRDQANEKGRHRDAPFDQFGRFMSGSIAGFPGLQASKANLGVAARGTSEDVARAD